MTIDTRFDCHMHSLYSDGSTSIDRMARSAIEKGLTTIAVTDHMPLPFTTRYAMDPKAIPAYRDDIMAAKKTYGERLTILSGMEMEFIPRHKDWIKEIKNTGWDMLLISIHEIVTDQGHFMVNGREDEFRQTLETVFKNDMRAFCETYFHLLQDAFATGWFDVAGHLDVIKKHNVNNKYFNETDTWYRELIHDTLDAIARNNLKMEINTNGLNHPAGAPYPSFWIVREAQKKGISILLGSDAHSPRFQGQYFDRIEAEFKGPT